MVSSTASCHSSGANPQNGLRHQLLVEYVSTCGWDLADFEDAQSSHRTSKRIPDALSIGIRGICAKPMRNTTIRCNQGPSVPLVSGQPRSVQGGYFFFQLNDRADSQSEQMDPSSMPNKVIDRVYRKGPAGNST